MKNPISFLLLAIALGMLVLLGDMYGFIEDNALKIVLLVAAAGFLISYMIIKYTKVIALRKAQKKLRELAEKQNKNKK